MRRADVSVHVDQRRLPCVLEPSLLLTHAQGPTLALRLVAVVEPWLTRSFWDALDNSELLTGRVPGLGGQGPIDLASLHALRRPPVRLHAVSGGDACQAQARAPSQARPRDAAGDASSAAAGPAQDEAKAAISLTALTRWIQLRERTDESAWVLRWVGDRIAESQLRDVEDLSLFDQFELMQRCLELRAQHRKLILCSPWQGIDWRRAALDALSLSAVLEGALVLCAAAPGREPALVVLARQLGFRVRDVGGQGKRPSASDAAAKEAALAETDGAPETLFVTERLLLREALARAGLATLAQQLPPLAVVHVVAGLVEPGSDAPAADASESGSAVEGLHHDFESLGDGDGDGDSDADHDEEDDNHRNGSHGHHGNHGGHGNQGMRAQPPSTMRMHGHPAPSSLTDCTPPDPWEHAQVWWYLL